MQTISNNNSLTTTVRIKIFDDLRQPRIEPNSSTITALIGSLVANYSFNVTLHLTIK